MPTFGPNPTTIAAARINVYLRDTWSAEWTLAPLLHPVDAVFACGPNLPTATLVWEYGWWSTEENPAIVARFKRPTTRQWVKIDYPTDGNGVRSWVGLVDFQDDQHAGETANLPDGLQTFTAYGLEKLLSEHQIDRSAWWDATAANGAGDWQFVDRVLPFNPRLDGRLVGNKQPGKNGFAVEDDDAETWSTAEIVEYLLEHLLPRAGDELASPMFFRFGYEGPELPTWDEPELDPTGLSWHEALNRLVHRRRLYLSRWRYEAGINRMVLVVDTMTADPVDIPLPGAPTVAAAANIIDLTCCDDVLSSLVLRAPALTVYDQTVIRGARRVSVGTFSYNEGSLAPAWTAAQETDYKNAASGEAGYAAWSNQKKQERNDAVRNSPALSDVYARYKIPDGWNRKLKDGLGGGAFSPAFPDNPAGAAIPYPVALVHTFLEERLPFLAGCDYTAGKIAAGTVDLTKAIGGYLPPLAFVQVPNTTPAEWLAVDKLGRLAAEPTDVKKNFKLSASCRVIPNTRHVRLDVTGQPQHAIGGYSFAPLSADKKLGMLDNHEGLLFTLAVPDDRYCQGVYPETVPQDQTLIRRKFLDAGDLYRQDYVVPQCVVGVAADGTLQRSTGGYLEKPGPNDAPHKLAALAKLAHAWYGVEHFVVGFETTRRPTVADLDLGMLIRDVNPGRNSAQTVNTSITEIRITSPKGTPGQQAPLRFQFTTWAGELDPFSAVPQPINPTFVAQASASAAAMGNAR